MRIFEGSKTLQNIKMGGVPTWTFLLCATTLLTQYAAASEPRVVCYYTNWSVYRPGTARFNPLNINPYLCTHLIYAFGGFTKDNTLKPFDKYQDIEKGGYAKFTGLKTYNNRLKTMLAIGGWNEGSTRFSPMVASRERRKEFVRNAIKFLRQNRFDGLDLDWEYPAFRDGGKPKDRDNYSKLVKELREEFDRESEKTGKPRLLLTMAVPAGIEYIQKGFDVKALNQYLDWMNLLTYDYHSAFEPAVNHHAPLYPLEEPNEYSVDNELNIDYTIQYYLENGADRDKLVLGIPTYGRSYTLFNPDATDIGSPADGPGEQGDATREKGYLAYYEICESLKEKPKKKRQSDEDDDDESSDEEEEEDEEDIPWTIMQPNPKAMGPVAFRGNQWVGYDDIDIVKKKADYVAEKGLGGIMFWSIDNDDFRGNCHGRPYPLIEAAKEAYISKLGITDNAITNERQSSSSGSNRRRNRPRVTSTTSSPTTSSRSSSNKRKPSTSSPVSSTTPAWNNNTPEPPTTPDPGSDFKCKDEGFFPHPRDCKKYFWCLDSGPSNLGIVAHQFTCPSGLFFNKAADSCDFSRNVLCKISTSTTTTTTTKPSTSTTNQPRTTTTTSKPAPAVTTTRRPNKLTSKNSVYFRTTSTTTLTPVLDDDEVYEEEIIDDAEAADIESEDPKVIKELIDLIKKAGGVEQLEKHLKLSESSVSQMAGTTTALPIPKKLYQKVLDTARQGGTNSFLNRYNSISRDVNGGQNSRVGPQNAGLESVPEASSARKDRPQYTTINRSRSTTTKTTEEASESREEPEAQEDEPKESLFKSRVTDSNGARPLPQYVNIRRARPSTQAPDDGDADSDDDDAARNALFERNEASFLSTVSDYPASPSPSSLRRETPEYVTIRRSRPTTTEPTTVKYQTNIRERPVFEDVQEEETIPPPAAPHYSTLQRTRPPTTTSPEELLTSPEPTTVLAVQISSLLNSPVTREPEVPTTESKISESDPTIPVTPEVPLTVTDASTTTTTVIPSSSSTPRRTILKRVRSTTTTTTSSPTSAAPQVSSERSYTFVRRRRPNDISSDTNESEGSLRKIRSTTPDSREANGNVKSNGEAGIVSHDIRNHSLLTTGNSDDTVAAAAAPVARGRLRPNLSRDELISLTPVEADNVATVSLDRNAPRPERKFRPRNKPATIQSAAAPDAEVSAATVEVRRPDFVTRGRSRFTVTRPSEGAANMDVTSTEATKFERRPAYTRFTPRPFSSFSSSSVASEKPLLSEDTPIINEAKVSEGTPRSPTRLPFGRVRPSTPRPIVPQARIVSQLFQRGSTTTESLADVDAYEDETENKNDDIHLSESTIEEKEHEDSVGEEAEEKPRRRVIVKKIRPSVASQVENTNDITSTSENDVDAIAVTPGDDGGRQRKFKVIRRRPTSTTLSVSQEPVTLSSTLETSSTTSSSTNRIRKIIRKKIISTLAESEIKPVQNKEQEKSEDEKVSVVLNYGDKAKPIVFSAKTQSIQSTTTSETVPSAIPTTSQAPLITENTETVTTPTPAPEESTSNSPPTEATSVISSKRPDEENENKSEEYVSLKIEPTEVSESTEPTSSTSSTTSTKSRFERPLYKPSRRPFTPSTEASVAPSSRTYSRKYNPGTYTSPSTIGEVTERTRALITRRPLFNAKPFSRRPFTTSSTTKKIEEEYSEEEFEDEEPEEIVEEPESKLVVVPANLHFTRGGQEFDENDDLDDTANEESSEEEVDQKINLKITSRIPLFRPKSVNSNTFRISTSTTEIPKRFLAGQNRTSIFNKSFAKTGTIETKKRVQNLPVHLQNIPKNNTANSNAVNDNSIENSENSIENTTYNTAETEESTTDDDYLIATISQDFTETENTNTYPDVTLTNTERDFTVTEPMEVDSSMDDYLESTELTQEIQTTENPTTTSHHIFSENQTEPNVPSTEYFTIEDNKLETVEQETTTTESVVKTHFDKLFSVSRVVEVSSKLDKHRLNKNNESRLIESGRVMQEKKPTVDKIGEVSRFTLIKIVEGDIPIYLTKLGHVYPVSNPPDNPIRIDEGRNARALMNFTDSGRENLVASESVNEAYRHINKVEILKKPDGLDTNPLVELLKNDNFEVHNNEDTKTEKSYSPYPVQWQFIPAAYENENAKDRQNKAAKSFEIITPRSYKTDPSTIALEGLFKTENPLLLAARKVERDEPQAHSNKPFVVYAAPRSNDNDPTNLVKLQVLKPENGRSVKTYVRGQEFSGISSIEEIAVKYPVSITILSPESEKENKSEMIAIMDSTPSTTESSNNHTTLNETPTTINTSPVTFSSETDTTTIAVESVMEADVTTPKTISSDALSEIAKKRPKLTFPRRPNNKNSNITRISISPLSNQDATPRTPKKNNSNLTNSNQKSNRTTGFNSNKSRFSANRSQNVPVDLRSAKKTKPGLNKTQNSTDVRVQPVTTDSRKLYLKPIRPNLLRPAFVLRKPSTQAPTQALPSRRNFLRRTKPTELPQEVTEALTEVSSNEVTTVFPEASSARETTTRKYRLRGGSKFDKKPIKSNLPEITYSPSKVSRNPPVTSDDARKPDDRRSGPKKRPSLLENETAAQTSGAVRRPTRTYVRRRYGGGANATTTTPIPTTSYKTSSSGSSEPTRRPFRVASRRRTTVASSTVAPATVAPATVTTAEISTADANSGKPSHDLAVQESMENENTNDGTAEAKPRVPQFKKTVKIQRRPLTSLTKEPPTSSTPVTEEPKKRESKKYSASFKQNQLDEVIRQKSAESANSEESTQSLEELSVDTAIAIAAHQLLGAPLPSTPSYDQDYTPTSSKKYSSSSSKPYLAPSTESYTGYPNSKDYSGGVTGFSNAPTFTSTVYTGITSSSGIPSSSPVYSRGSSSYVVPTSNRYLPITNKYVSVPIDDFGYSTDSYSSGLGHEPAYFTRDYLMESPITRKYETDYQYLAPITTEQPTTRTPKRPTAFRRISTTIAPPSQNILILPPVTPQPRRRPDKGVKVYDKIPKTEKATYRPILNYDYYDDGDERLLDRYTESNKVSVNGKGIVECLDQGNFPHPASCRKFISCARMEGGALIGWEYVCPQGLSYDPVGGICNWSAGLGCNE